MRLILLGGPGAGKGTNAEVLAARYGIPHISTGDIFRKNIKNKTELGLEIKDFVKKGKLVPDDITVEVVRRRLAEKDCMKGFVLDGFPRNVAQADHLDAILSDMGIKIDHVINLDADDEVIIKRMTERRVCTGCGSNYNLTSNPSDIEGVCDSCGGTLIQRQDDNEETIRHRLMIYHQQTEPLIKYYEKKGLLITVDSSKTVAHTSEQLDALLPEPEHVKG